MIKWWRVPILCLFYSSLFSQDVMNAKPQSIYQYVVEDIDGKDFDFSTLKGKKIMIVNTASECGLTPQYEKLQAMYDRYKDRDFVIIGFPSNDFLRQEPGSNAEIKSFCSLKYKITFPMMSKMVVKKGESQAAIYKYLTQKAENGLEDSKVKWNFQKYLIDEKGILVKVIAPRTLPDDREIISWIEAKS